MVDIMPPDPDSKLGPPEPTATGVAQMMAASADPFTREVAALVGYVGEHHRHPVTCGECRDGEYPCLLQDTANSVAFAWLLKVVEERG